MKRRNTKVNRILCNIENPNTSQSRHLVVEIKTKLTIENCECMSGISHFLSAKQWKMKNKATKRTK